MSSKKNSNEFNNIGIQEVTMDDLPISCPMPSMALWNAHPRVYLPIEEAGEIICPYCSTLYKLKEK